MHILFHKLISKSSNKKFEFLPVQSEPGGLQDLNLEVDYIVFFKIFSNIQIYILCFISWPVTPKIRNLIFLPVYSWPEGL